VFPALYEHHLHITGKAISVTGRSGLKACEVLRILHCLYIRLRDGDAVSLTRRPRSTPRNLFISASFIRFC
jgi:hypothetical protein